MDVSKFNISDLSVRPSSVRSVYQHIIILEFADIHIWCLCHIKEEYYFHYNFFSRHGNNNYDYIKENIINQAILLKKIYDFLQWCLQNCSRRFWYYGGQKVPSLEKNRRLHTCGPKVRTVRYVSVDSFIFFDFSDG